MPCANACSSSPGTWPPRPATRLSTIDPERVPSSTTVASISSPSWSCTSPVAGSRNLAELDRRLGLAPDGDEGRRGADGDHAPADDVARSDTEIGRAHV